MAASLVYRTPWVYELVMLALYGRHYPARYRAIAGLIPEGASVLDLCCGPGFLYDRHLRRKSVDYTGLDINPGFVERVRRQGGRALVWDLHDDRPLPVADVVMMQASLYHFLPDAGPIVDRMRRAARRSVVIAEPIRNLSDSRVPLLGSIARRHTDAGRGARPSRFTEPALDELFRALAIEPRQALLIPGGREKIYVFDPIGEDGATPDD